MSEIALVSARKARLELDAKRGNKSAQTALKLAGEPDRFLSTIQIGITLIGILTGLYSGEAFAYNLAEVVRHVPVLEPYALGVSKTIIVIIVTYLTLIMGELVPKRIGMGMPNGFRCWSLNRCTFYRSWLCLLSGCCRKALPLL